MVAAHPEAERVIAALIMSWGQVFRLTTIDQACAALGVAARWPTRRAVADRLAAAPGLSPVLRRWEGDEERGDGIPWTATGVA